MSRIGKRSVTLPKGVTVTESKGFFEVKGPKGSIQRPLPGELSLEQKDGEATVLIKNDVDVDDARALWGTTRALLASAITGVTEGFKRNLKLEGTGYKADLKGTVLTLSVGRSHPVVYEVPKAVSVKIPPESKGTVLQLESFDKAVLGQLVANLQKARKPEPYQGKGVNIEGVKIRRKAGKAGKAGGKK